MFKLAINAGHWNGTTRGVPSSMSPKDHPNEWVLNARVVEAVISRLKKYDNIEYLRIDDPTGKQFVEDRDRYGKANSWNADFYLAIHHNGGIGGGTGGGIVSYSYLKDKFSGDNSYAWSNALYEAIVKKTGLKGNRANPVVKADLFEVRETKMPAVLLELGFMDSQTDLKYILDHPKWANNCADAIVSVIVKRWKLKEKEEVFKYGEKNLGIYAMKRIFAIGKKLGVKACPRGVEDNGGYGAGVDANVKAVQKAAGLPQKDEANEATVRAAWKFVDDAVSANTAELKDAKKKLSEAQAKIDKLIKNKGDIDGDGAVSMKDVLALRKIIIGSK